MSLIKKNKKIEKRMMRHDIKLYSEENQRKYVVGFF